MRDWGEVGRVRLCQNAIVRNEPQQSVIRPFAKRYDAAEGYVPTRFERRLRKGMRSCEAVQNAFHSRRPCFCHHRPRIVFSITRVDHDRALQLGRQHQLFRECAPLLEARGIVIVIIESTFANRCGTIFDKREELPDMRCGIEARSIVRMNADGMKNVTRVLSRKRRCVVCSGQHIVCTAAGSDADYCAGTGLARPLNYLVAVAGERRVGEVRVAVDEVWNAVVLRGHLRSIQSRTGLAM